VIETEPGPERSALFGCRVTRTVRSRRRVEKVGGAQWRTTAAGGGTVAAFAPRRAVLGWATGVKELNILLALLALCAFLSLRSDAFLTQGNLFGVARAFSLTAIVAIGQTMVIITGDIDLSVGSVLALSGITTGMLLGEG
jgi:predicted ABC-type sugar transport system permease subunit